jgi:cysteinyl-tRNA synthetase
LDLQENFLNALDDDFNSEKALSYLHELKGLISKGLLTAGRERLSQLKKLFEDFAGTSLGIVLPEEQNVDESLQNLLKEREDARKNKNWTESDRLRKIIDEKGYKISDSKDGNSSLVKKI